LLFRQSVLKTSKGVDRTKEGAKPVV